MEDSVIGVGRPQIQQHSDTESKKGRVRVDWTFGGGGADGF